MADTDIAEGGEAVLEAEDSAGADSAGLEAGEDSAEAVRVEDSRGSSSVKKLDTLVGAVQEGLGTNLITLLEFGPRVRGESRREPGPSLMLIVQDASPTALRPIEPAIATWVTRHRYPVPLIFSQSEWLGSADVFPIEIEDMRDAHRLLCGSSPFENMQTRRDDLRHQLERELRGKLLQLRAEYAAVAPDGRALGDLLDRSVGTFLVLLRAVLRLLGESIPDRPRNVVDTASRLVGSDASPYAWALDGIEGKKRPKLTAFDPLATSYLEAVEALVRFVDEFQDHRADVSPETHPSGET